MQTIEGRDAAYAENIGSFGGVVAGYYGGPWAFHVWSPNDWQRFSGNYKLPIWVGATNGEMEGDSAVSALRSLNVPRGIATVIDMESRVDSAYVTAFGNKLFAAGYKVFVYGSASTVFGNPQLSGYWVADWTGQAHMYSRGQGGHDGTQGIRGTQYVDTGPYDLSLWKEWILPGLWR